jgi:hypothetical protein
MKIVASFGLLLAAGAGALIGQMHKVAKPETVVRAVGVYEWTGDMAKPAASRLIPVTLYIDKHLEDAGLYLARPVPFALQSGNLYELDEAGVPKGNLDLVYARHLQAANLAQAYDDGWFGYGSFKPLAVPKKTVARKLPPARTVGIETSGGQTVANVDQDKPHFTDKSGRPVTPASAGTDAAKPDAAKPDAAKPNPASDSTASAKTTAAADDPDRPTMKRRSGSDTTDVSTTATPSASSSTPATPATSSTTTPDDPDRPTMKRRSGNDTADATAESSGPSASDDPDRPTLKRHSVEDAKKKQKAASESTVTGVGSLNDDPDRPNLHRGKPAGAMTEDDLPRLAGLPADLHQMVAVSDAANRPIHDFSRAWDDDAERAAVLGKMQAMAQAQLAAYATGSPAAPAAKPTPAKPASAKSTSAKRRTPQPAAPATVPLLDEQLKGYLLSYGDVPTFVYQAHTDGTGESLRYVTLVAQCDAQGEPKLVLHNVTDAAHLDQTPRLRLVDAVDVEASNRASLLFEMRGQSSRQFGVYRVLGLQAEQTFSTGTMQ